MARWMQTQWLLLQSGRQAIPAEREVRIESTGQTGRFEDTAGR